jgi:hypothetical protein
LKVTNELPGGKNQIEETEFGVKEELRDEPAN